MEDGTTYEGFAFAGAGEFFGEAVFNTAMSGYQETITDPSYKGQILTMTYPLIGNYGINDEDMESEKIHLEALIVKEYQPHYSNWRARKSLKAFLEEQEKLGVEGIDTRALTRKLRLFGAMKCVISTLIFHKEELQERLDASPSLVGRDLVKEVTCRVPYLWENNNPQHLSADWQRHDNKYLVVVIDCGVKYSILRELEKRDCQVLIVPATTRAEQILAYCPDGVLFSNGPGDPAALPYLVETARALIGIKPIFGICLGHQILGQALGGVTEKLKFGHRGINQPAQSLDDGRVLITSQNHGFVLRPKELPHGVKETFINLNDGTSEGIIFPDKGVFSVQYHPEAAPGPQDVQWLFDDFLVAMEARMGKGKH